MHYQTGSGKVFKCCYTLGRAPEHHKRIIYNSECINRLIFFNVSKGNKFYLRAAKEILDKVSTKCFLSEYFLNDTNITPREWVEYCSPSSHPHPQPNPKPTISPGTFFGKHNLSWKDKMLQTQQTPWWRLNSEPQKS